MKEIMNNYPAQVANTKQREKTGTQYEGWLSVSQAALLMGISTSTLRRMEEGGKITSERKGNGYRFFRESDVEELNKTLIKERNSTVRKPLQPYHTQPKKKAPIIKMGRKNVMEKNEISLFNTELITRMKKVVNPEYLMLIFVGFLTFFLVTSADTFKNKINDIKSSKTAYYNTGGKNITNSANILGIRDKVTNYIYNINVPTNIKNNLNVDGVTTTTELAFNGIARILGLQDVDNTTEDTLERILDVNGEVVGTGLNDLKISNKVITVQHLSDALAYGGDWDFSGTWAIDGTEVTITGEQLNDLADNSDTLISLAASQVTEGGIAFGDGSAYAQDTTNFVWDDTNNRLGVGTATPAYTVDIAGNLNTTSLLLAGSAVTANASELNYLDGATVTNGGIVFGDGTKLTQDVTGFYWNATTNNLGIGTSDPQYNLDILGNAQFSGNVIVGGTSISLSGTNTLFTQTQNGANLEFRTSTEGEIKLISGTNALIALTPSNEKVYVEGDGLLVGEANHLFTADISSDIVQIGTNFYSSNLLNVDGNVGIGDYLFFGNTSGGVDLDSSYGIRSNGGTMQVKNTNGVWSNVATAGGLSPSGTNGAVQFTDGTNFVADSVNFNWNDTQNYLTLSALRAIGTTNPLSITDHNGTLGITVKSGGFVGINNTNPSNQLDVVGNISTTTDLYIAGTGLGSTALSSGATRIGIDYGSLSNAPSAMNVQEALAALDGVVGASAGDIQSVGSVTSGQAFDSIATADGKWLGLGSADGRIAFSTAPGNSQIHLLDARIGIGTTNAGSALDVNGEIRGTKFTFTNDTNNYLEYLTTDTIGLGTSGQTRLTVDGTGKVGIGTTNPDASLTIQPTSAQALNIKNYGTSAGQTGEMRLYGINGTYMGFKAPDSAPTNQIYVLPPVDGLSNQVLTTDGSGNLTWQTAAGVGATSNGDIESVGSVTSGSAFSDSSADGQWLGLGAAAGRMYFSDDTTDEISILDANLGIGKTNPVYPLDVNGTLRGTSLTDGTATLTLGSITNLTNLTMSGTIDVGTNTISEGNFNGNWTYNSGNLSGINNLTTNGVITMNNSNTGTDNTVLILNSSNQVVTDEIDSRVWDTSLTDGTGISNYLSKWLDANTLANSLVYDNGTYVGIGNTNPTVALDVTGTIKGTSLTDGTATITSGNATGLVNLSASGTISFSGIGSTNTGDNILVKATDGKINYRALDPRTWGSSLTDGSGVSSYLARWLDSNTLGTGVIYDNGTNVGIGNTNPNVALDVTGTINASTELSIGGIGLGATGSSNTTSGAFKIGVFDEFSYSNSTNVQGVLNDLDNQLGMSLGQSISGTGPTNYITKYSAITGTIQASNIFDNGTNIGIGNTNPTTKLDVTGTVKGTTLSDGTASITSGNATGLANISANGTITFSGIGSTDNGNNVLVSNGAGVLNYRAINQKAWSNTLTDGSGISNYLARWIGTSTMGTGSIYDNGTSIGIGTTGLTSALNITPSSVAGVQLNPFGSTPSQFRLLDADSSAYAAFVAPSVLTENTVYTLPTNNGNTNEVLVSDGDGNLSWQSVTGIGAGTGTITAVGSVTSGNAFASISTADGKWLGLGAANARIAFSTAPGNSQIHMIDGRVGIGTTNASEALSVQGNVSVSGSVDLGTNTIADGNLNGNWSYNNGNITSIANITSNGTITFSGIGSTDNGNNVLVANGAGILNYRAIDSRAWGSTLTDGSGVSSYLARWLDSNTLGTGVLYDNGTNVGIGNTNPNVALDVTGTINASTELSIGGIGLGATGSSNTTSGAFKIGVFDEFSYSNSTNVQGVLNDLDNQLGMTLGQSISGTGPTNYITKYGAVSGTIQASNIFDDGTNVGIGNTNPTTKLDVTGTIKGTTLSDGTATISSGTLDLGTNTITDGQLNGNWNFNSGSASSLSSVGTTSLTASGTVTLSGVGSTDTGTNTLIVDGTGKLSYRSLDSRTFGSTLTDGSGISNYLSRWLDENTMGTGVIYDNGTNIGIGKTNPSVALDVNGAITASSTVTGSSLTDGTASLSSGTLNNAVNINMSGTIDLGTNTIYDGNLTGSWSLNSGSLTSVNNITMSGTLDLGTNTILDGNLNGNWNFNGGSASSLSSVGTTSFTASGIVTLSGLGSTDNGNNILTLNTTTGKVDYRSTDARIWGTTLTDGSGASNYLSRWLDANTLGTGIIYDTTTYVGIGTTNPQYKLDVNGNARISTLASGSTDTVVTQSSGVLETRTIDSRVWGSTITDGSGISNYLSRWLDANTMGTGVIYDSGSLVGIGKTNPAVALDVVGAITASSTVTGSSLTDGTASLSSGTLNNIVNINMSGAIDLGTNTIDDGVLTGNWNFSGGSASSLSSVGTTSLTASGAVTLSGIGSTNFGTNTLVIDGTGKVNYRAIDDRALGTTLVDGSGISNYLTRWLDANSIKEGTVWDNGTYVGVGTTSSTAKFEVETSTTENRPAVIIDQNDATNNPKVLQLENAGTGDAIYIDSGEFIVDSTGNLTTTGTTGITLASSADLIFGTVGIRDIGTDQATSGASLIGFYGTGNTYATGDDVQEAIKQIDTQLAGAFNGVITGVGSMSTGDVFANSTADNQWLGLGSTAGRIYFDDLATDKISILDAYLGVGTSSPLNTVDILGNAVIGATYAGTNTAPTSGLLVQGSVGLGTVSPLNKLDVSGSMVIGSSYAGTNTAPTNGLLVQGALGVNTTTITNGFEAFINGDLGIAQGGYLNVGATYGASGYGLRDNSGVIEAKDLGGNWVELVGGGYWNLIGSSAPTATVALDQNYAYNLGIGTTGATQRLHVVGNILSTATVYMTTADFGTNTIYDGNLTGDWAFNNGSLYGINNLTAAGSITFAGVGSTNSGSNALVIDSNGNVRYRSVAIGTGTSNYLTRWLDATTIGTGSVYDNGTNVGIGTTNMSYKLNVAGTTMHQDTAYFANGSTYYIDSSGNAKFHNIISDDTSNPGISVGNGATGSIKVGSATLRDDATTYLSVDSDSNATDEFRFYNAGDLWSRTGSFLSDVINGSTAVGFTLNTNNSLSTQGSKLLSVKNNGTEKMYLDSNGNLYVSGTVTSGNGTSTLLTNKSGTAVSNRSLVIVDSSNNSSFTTTTTPYSKAAYGVVVGVGLGVTNDADGDGVCDANDVCMVAYAGEVEVNVKNASTAAKGEYLFTSDTAGSAVASAKQFDGLLGIVTNTSGAGSGYVKMIFHAQPQVTAAAAMDKSSKHNDYWLYANSYSITGEGSNIDSNMLARGLAFDTLDDTTKIDSTNTTVSVNTYDNRAGLIGGQSFTQGTTDTYGNALLGSTAIVDMYFYDRTVKDSSAQVQVELGIDPNWYNGVTLATIDSSTNPSSTETNANLSTSYNGSLLKVTGSYASSPSTIYITIKSSGTSTTSPATFDWTDNAGAGSTNVSMTPGTSQALGATGVSVTFTNTQYNVGDVFKIASWYTEPASSTRGTKQQFPERSILIANASGIDIMDADTQKLWMRFSQGTNYALGADANNNPSGTHGLNGKVYVSENGSSATGLYTLDFVNDTTFRYDATDYRVSDKNLANRNTTNTFNQITVTQSIATSYANDVAAEVIPNQPTQEVTVSGWGYLAGNGANAYNYEYVNLPYTFTDIPKITISYSGYSGANPPTTLNECYGTVYPFVAFNASYITNNSFYATFGDTYGSTWGTTSFPCYTWTATGTVSPKQYVAVSTGNTGTDGGTTVINETNRTKANIALGSQHANTLWETKVALVNNTLYSTLYETTPNNAYVIVYKSVGGISTETAWTGQMSGYYNVFQNGTNWSSSGPTILGTNTGVGQITSITATANTSTINPEGNTVYISTNSGVTVLNENVSKGNALDEGAEKWGSAKYYTKDYISEEMVGDIRGMWPLNADNAASDFEDVSVKGVILSGSGITAADSAPGVRGMAYDFDGSTEYLYCIDGTCGGTGKIELTSATFSMGAWIKTTDTAGVIMSKFNNNINAQFTLSIGASQSCAGTNGKINLCTYDGSTVKAMTGNRTVNDGNWHHIVVTQKPAGTGFIGKNIYIDGVLDATSADVHTTLQDAGTFAIGVDFNTSVATNFYSGIIDEAFITATYITPDKIKDMYEVGYKALQSHNVSLGSGTLHGNQTLGFTGVGTSSIGVVAPDWNNQYMYVGMNSTTLGGLSKIDLKSDTNVKTYTSSANVPAGGTTLLDEDVNALAVGYKLEAVGSAASGIKTMGYDGYATATSGNFVGSTITTPESFNQAYLWAQYVTDSSDTSNTVQVWASNDGGSNYYQCNLTNTDTNTTPSEYEYFCQFNTPGSSLKTKFVFNRGSTKTNTYVHKYGIAWIDNNNASVLAGGSNFFTVTGSVTNGSYLELAHNQGTNDVVATGWVYNTDNSQWDLFEGTSEENVTLDLMEYTSDGDAQSSYISDNYLSATGGTTSVSGFYNIHKFNSSGTFTPAGSGTAEVLVVGGGGGGGGWVAAHSDNNATGGGGAGGIQYNAAYSITGSPVTVTVGSGGSGGNRTGTSGGNSIFGSITALGGGPGGYSNSESILNGASGGGALVGSGGTGTQGNNGGTGYAFSSSYYRAGGGGGAGAAGADGYTSGNGGNGVAYSITGASVYYAGGGGGSCWQSSYSCTPGTGGLGGGGNGKAAGGVGVAGTANTGGGGGAGMDAIGGAGGSGVVIVRYPYLALQSYTENTIVQEGSYALKIVAKDTISLNSTIKRTISPTVNLTDQTSIKFYMRSSRTGSNVKLGIHDAGGTTTEITPNITSSEEYLTFEWDISGVANEFKDAIDSLIITIVNADADNTFYLDGLTTVNQYKLTQVDNNTIRLYNFSGATKSLRLDAITGASNTNSGGVHLAPLAADVDSGNYTNSIWINKTGTGGNLLKLQTSGTDVFTLTADGTATLTGSLTTTGNINAESGSLQTNSITRIDNSGNATLSIASIRDLILGSQTSAPTSPSEGQMYFNSDENESYIYKNGAWSKMLTEDAGSCPTGYVLVPGDSDFGTEDFCVMKYEAKMSVDKTPISVAGTSPWVSIDWYEAKAACERAGAHLITNAEWMTIARNIEATAINDLDSDASLQLATGHSDNAPASALATTDSADPVVSGCNLSANMEDASNAYSASSCEIRGDGSYGGDNNDKGYYGTSQTWATTGYSAGAANKSQMRTSVLNNGSVIWDISGNVWEWSDWQCGTGVWNTNAGWLEWNNAGLTDYEKYAAGPSGSLTSANGSGQYYGCTANGNGALRGGRWNNTTTAGPFSLDLNNTTSIVWTGLGFRCAQ